MVWMEDLVPKEHLLRKIDAAVDFDKLYEMVEDLYSEDKGRPSIDPVVLVKMVLIQHLWACQEFCVNEIKTFEKSIENDVDLCHFFAYVSHPVPHRRSSLPRMIPQFG